MEEKKRTSVQRDLHGVRMGGGRGAKNGADAARGRIERGRARGKKRGGCGARARRRCGCGARVEERAWRCGDDDGVVV